MSIERAARAQRVRGVYLLTPDIEPGGVESMLSKLDAAVAAGAAMVQFRSKPDGAIGGMGTDSRRALAQRVQAVARRHSALFIVNDDVDLALALEADGVHLGRDDGDLHRARAKLPHQLLGVSCYDNPERADEAIRCGADLIAFGSMFPSGTKPGAVRASLDLLRRARLRHPDTRVVAIGGICAGNIRSVAEAGAHAAAVIGAVFTAADAAGAARRLSDEFARGQAEYERERTAV